METEIAPRAQIRTTLTVYVTLEYKLQEILLILH